MGTSPPSPASPLTSPPSSRILIFCILLVPSQYAFGGQGRHCERLVTSSPPSVYRPRTHIKQLEDPAVENLLSDPQGRHSLTPGGANVPGLHVRHLLPSG